MCKRHDDVLKLELVKTERRKKSVCRLGLRNLQRVRENIVPVRLLFNFFFFLSRRGHTFWPVFWFSEVCSAELLVFFFFFFSLLFSCFELQSDRKRVVLGKGVDLGGRRIIKKKKTKKYKTK